MGSRQSQAYLASPAVVAESAARGYIAGPKLAWEEGGAGVGDALGQVMREAGAGQQRPEEQAAVALQDGFVSRIEGEVVLCLGDNIDTDGIYSGRHCYVDMDRAAQAHVAMENYDPSFATLIRQGDVLVAGENFGCGSSREQAATALLACGISVVVVASANETYKRNALNNGLLLIEAPALVDHIKTKATAAASPSLPPTLRTGFTIDMDFVRSRARVGGQEFGFAPVGAVAQELILAGGLEGWVQQKMMVRAEVGADGGTRLGEGGGMGVPPSPLPSPKGSTHQEAM